MPTQSGGKGSKKIGRSKKKAEGRNHPISLFIRGKMSAKAYFEATGQGGKKVGGSDE